MSMVKQELEQIHYNRAKLWQIILFTLNNTSTNLYLFTVGFLTYYATGVVGLAVLMVSSILGVIRIFDGAIDPAIGVFIDKTETKFGKYRPIILIGNFISILSFILLFSTHKMPMAARIVVLVIALVIHKIGYSLQASVTKAGQTVLTNDPKQRPLFGIFDGIYNIGVFTGGQLFVARYLVPKYGGKFTEGLFLELIIIVMTLSLTMAFLAVLGIAAKDRKEFFGLGEETTETSLREYWSMIKGNRPLQMLTLAAASDKLAITIFSDSVVNVILFGIILGNYALSGDIAAYSVIPDLVITFGAVYLARKMDLKTAFSANIAVAMFSYLGIGAMLLLVNDLTSISFKNFGFVTLLFVILYSVAKSCSRTPTTLVITMTADISDYETNKSGRYVAGMIGTLFSFIDSIASSFGPMLVGWICAAIGFTEKFPAIGDTLTKPLFWAGIIMVSILPAALLLLSLVLMKFYSLDKKEMAKIQAGIDEKKHHKVNATV